VQFSGKKKAFFLLNAAFAMAILHLICHQVPILSITESIIQSLVIA
jgi:hypothetical protein